MAKKLSLKTENKIDSILGTLSKANKYIQFGMQFRFLLVLFFICPLLLSSTMNWLI